MMVKSAKAEANREDDNTAWETWEIDLQFYNLRGDRVGEVFRLDDDDKSDEVEKAFWATEVEIDWQVLLQRGEQYETLTLVLEADQGHTTEYEITAVDTNERNDMDFINGNCTKTLGPTGLNLIGKHLGGTECN